MYCTQKLFLVFYLVESKRYICKIRYTVRTPLLFGILTFVNNLSGEKIHKRIGPERLPSCQFIQTIIVKYCIFPEKKCLCFNY